MNDLESELKKLRPLRPSSGLMVRIELALADAGKVPDNVITPHRFRVNWLGVGLGVAVAATFLILARIDFHPAQKSAIASATPARAENAAAYIPKYRADGLTQVVYEQRDEGLVFPAGAEEPLRRVRTSKRETLRWQDLNSGAQLQVSYPTEEIMLVPVSGQ